MKVERLARRHVVLMGIGHTNAHVVRMWGMHPLPDTDLTCISNAPLATYSGMLPAVLSGQVPEEQMQIDLVRLCSATKARLILDPVIGLDHIRQEVLFANRPPIPFDVLSVGIGSRPSMEGVSVSGDGFLTIKPMQDFMQRLADAVTRTVKGLENRTLRVAIVGGGAAGIEILFCLPPFLRGLTGNPFTFHLVTQSAEVLGDASRALRRRVRNELREREIQVTLEKSVTHVAPGHLCLEDGSSVEADLVIWATGAAAPPELKELQLPLDERGFLATDLTLRSVSGKPVFAVGDCGSIVDQPLAKSGVYAVRQGPVLWRNIQNLLAGRSLETYRPQASFMKLLNLGDDRAMGEWRGISFSGRWVLRLKHFIDRRFMEKFAPASMRSPDEEPMQCRGCGCKLDSDALAGALDTLANPSYQIARDDAVAIGNGKLASTDFFSAPFADPYLNGRVTALHCAADLLASGALVEGALANVVLPEGDSKSQQKTLSDFLAGAQREFHEMGAAILGGHTIVGPRMEAGFTVFGKPLRSVIKKGNLRPGDRLFLTKPLGIGVLLAAHMMSECSADAFEVLMETMLQHQEAYVGLMAKLQIDAATDITGFGLAGHLIEMLKASKTSAVVRIESLPVLSGAEAAAKKGIDSSLAPANRRAESLMSIEPKAMSSNRYPLLFDPQTCGGLLIGVPREKVDQFLRETGESGLVPPVEIGEVNERTPAKLFVI